MEGLKRYAPWTMQQHHQFLCYLWYIFKDFSCFFGEKALGPMPSRRESLQQFARSFCNISSLLLFASSNLRKTILKSRKETEDRSIYKASLPKLLEFWALVVPPFAKLRQDITLWSLDKTKRESLSYDGCGLESQYMTSPFNADYNTMAEMISYAEVSLCEMLRGFQPLSGSSFEIDSHM